jgi:hypothetical protein
VVLRKRAPPGDRRSDRGREEDERDGGDGEGEGEPQVEEPRGDDRARDEEVDDADERGRHLAATLLRRELVQLLLRVEEAEPVPCARRECACDEQGERMERRREHEYEQPGREHEQTGGLVAAP